ncbi:hypothetical protein CDL12_24600 [Handroanthus impetiginosus]|uniref:Retrotransposon gag domain-containing protein n=1 Tax=Handroanthus impetiginosus TaxID=429701 RepID=A0A2G9GCG1_9LAMI|nr:hypothetical protein CDL12_24600 [Handroanthus impetiginosus]
MEFPKFSGEDLKCWLFVCEQFFDVARTPLNLRVKLTSIHLVGETLQWHQVFIKSRLTMTLPSWEEYIQVINKRFGGQMVTDPIIELMHLQRKGSVQEYWKEFDELVNRLGLLEDIATRVETYNPKSLRDTARIATLLERNYSVRDRIKTGASRLSLGSSKNTVPINYNRNAPNTTIQAAILALPPSRNQIPVARGGPIRVRRLTPQEMNERWAMGLCFNCDEKFALGHQCENQRRQLFAMEIKETEDEGTLNFEIDEILTRIDNLDRARRLRYKFEHTTPYSVTIAGGQKLTSDYICKDFTWKIQRIEFRSNIMTILLEGGDLWLVTLWDILFNFEDLKMEFVSNAKKIIFKGNKIEKPKLLSGRKVSKLLNKTSQLAMVSFGVIQRTDYVGPSLFSLKLNNTGSRSELDNLLDTHAQLFDELKSLPPSRAQDHRITLKEGTSPINVRPYRYPSSHKDEIKKNYQITLRKWNY